MFHTYKCSQFRHQHLGQQSDATQCEFFASLPFLHIHIFPQQRISHGGVLLIVSPCSSKSSSDSNITCIVHCTLDLITMIAVPTLSSVLAISCPVALVLTLSSGAHSVSKAYVLFWWWYQDWQLLLNFTTFSISCLTFFVYQGKLHWHVYHKKPHRATWLLCSRWFFISYLSSFED